MMTIVSLGTIGTIESKNATPKMIARKYQFEEKSASQSEASVNTLARTAASIAAARYRFARPGRG